MRKFLLNLAPGETLALVQELPRFDNTIKPKLVLASALELCFRDLISGFLFHAIWLISVGGNCFAISEVSINGGKYG
jgi:hypothetical protein